MITKAATVTGKPKRRWYCNLRTLLLLMLLASIFMVWVVVRLEQANRQREVVETIVELGGRVLYDYQMNRAKSPGPAWLRKLLGNDFFTNVVGVSFRRQRQFTGAGLEQLAELAQLQSLYLGYTQVADGGLRHIQGLTQLKALSLGHTQVSGAGLEYLEGLTQLNALFLDHTQVGDAGLEHLAGLGQLRQLHLDYTKVTDAGLQHLKGLTQLQRLYLGNTHVTDEGLEHLKGLTKLRWLNLAGTQVTDRGVRKLRRAVPNCTIQRPHGIMPPGKFPGKSRPPLEKLAAKEKNE